MVKNQDLIESLNTIYGIKVTGLELLPLGADIDSSVYKAQSHDQFCYFVKLKRGNTHDVGTEIQLLLHNAGIQQTIPPVKTIHNQAFHHSNNFVLTVYPFIEGQDGFSKNLSNEQWIVLGKALRQIHTYKVPATIKNHIKQESYSPQWRDIVRSIYTHIDTKQTATDEIALKLLAFMKNHRETIMQLVHHADQLREKIKDQSPDFVLCHSDIHAGNVLLTDDNGLYIVDWDQPILAPKERDLMFIGAGIANVWNNPDEAKLFYNGYGKTEINKDILAYYRYERIVEDVAQYSQQLLLTSDGGKDRAIMYKHFVDMFEPRGVVEIAFKTALKEYENCSKEHIPNKVTKKELDNVKSKKGSQSAGTVDDLFKKLGS